MNRGALSKPAELPRELTLLDSTAIVIGTTIGVAIFIVPGTIARELPSPAMILATWVIAGIITFFGALAYAELGAMLPDSGGQYIYLREAYGPLAAFICGWVSFLIVQSGSIAAVCVGFGIYLSYLLPGHAEIARWSPAVLIIVFSWINYRGVRWGAHTQRVFTGLKITGLLVLIGSSILYKAPDVPARYASSGSLTQNGFVIALLGCFVAYDGWQYIAFVAGEVRDPSRNVPRSIALGTAAVIFLYLSANLAYFHVLPIAQIASTERVAAVTAELTMGRIGATIIALTIMLSAAGAANGAILTSPRIYFAQARDGLFFQKVAEIHPRFKTPSASIVVQCIWSCILALSGSYETLFSFVLFAMWLFHGMTVFGVLILRRKAPELRRPYRMWGYPVTPVVFTLFALWLVVNTFQSRPVSSLTGALIIAAGAPVYYLWRKKTRNVY